jgi:hypothetical protein
MPQRPSLPSVGEAAKARKGCELWVRGTQIGRAFKVTAQRGELMVAPLAPVVVATVHPSSILRVPDDETRRLEMKRFTEDLRKVVRALSSHGGGGSRAAPSNGGSET